MKLNRRIVAGALALSVLGAAAVTVHAQVKRPYHDGTVWNVTFVRMKPGMDSAYLNYLASDWKRNQEAAKKEGLIVSYKILSTEAHSPDDWNLILMTETKDLASMEANQDKADALTQKMVGDDQKQMQGYKDRSEIREIMGIRQAREIVLEPKP
jgi:hypothetical protein